MDGQNFFLSDRDLFPYLLMTQSQAAAYTNYNIKLTCNL